MKAFQTMIFEELTKDEKAVKGKKKFDSPASNQYLPFQYQSCKLLFNEDQWYVISSGVISGEYVPTITPGTNVTNVTLISAIYVATTEKANSNGIMVTVNLVLDVESTAAAT